MGLTAGFRPHFIGGNNHLPDASAPAPVHPLTTEYWQSHDDASSLPLSSGASFASSVEAGRRHWRCGADTVDIFAGGRTAENRDLAAKIHALGLPAIQQRSKP